MAIVMKPAAWIGQMVFPTIQEAQKKEILDLVETHSVPIAGPSEAVNFIVDHTDEIVAILTCQPRTKKVRSDKGTKRKKPVEVAA